MNQRADGSFEYKGLLKREIEKGHKYHSAMAGYYQGKHYGAGKQDYADVWDFALNSNEKITMNLKNEENRMKILRKLVDKITIPQIQYGTV